MRRHLTALMWAAADAISCVWPFGWHWWSVALAVATAPATYILSARRRPSVEGGARDA